MSRRAELDAFLSWLLGKDSQGENSTFGTARSFRRRTSWCWNIIPEAAVTEVVHDEIQLD